MSIVMSDVSDKKAAQTIRGLQRLLEDPYWASFLGNGIAKQLGVTERPDQEPAVAFGKATCLWVTPWGKQTSETLARHILPKSLLEEIAAEAERASASPAKRRPESFLADQPTTTTAICRKWPTQNG
jgi:hypothetical protein